MVIRPHGPFGMVLENNHILIVFFPLRWMGFSWSEFRIPSPVPISEPNFLKFILFR
jgi:hypothetical protein